MAGRTNGIVLSTDNYTEFLAGFWTLHGDVGDYGMIQNLWKTEVYGMSRYLVEEYTKDKAGFRAAALLACIEAVPTDGLGITNSDFDQIMPDHDRTKTPEQLYHEVDMVMLDMIRGKADKNNPIVKRYEATHFKRNNPVSISRTLIL
jgi:NH3-dependent NAD+ synthetase